MTNQKTIYVPNLSEVELSISCAQAQVGLPVEPKIGVLYVNPETELHSGEPVFVVYDPRGFFEFSRETDGFGGVVDNVLTAMARKIGKPQYRFVIEHEATTKLGKPEFKALDQLVKKRNKLLEFEHRDEKPNLTRSYGISDDPEKQKAIDEEVFNLSIDYKRARVRDSHVGLQPGELWVGTELAKLDGIKEDDPFFYMMFLGENHKTRGFTYGFRERDSYFPARDGFTAVLNQYLFMLPDHLHKNRIQLKIGPEAKENLAETEKKVLERIVQMF